jgi:hypothetical protein
MVLYKIIKILFQVIAVATVIAAEFIKKGFMLFNKLILKTTECSAVFKDF